MNLLDIAYIQGSKAKEEKERERDREQEVDIYIYSIAMHIKALILRATHIVISQVIT